MNNARPTISQTLAEQLDDLLEIYQDAKVNDDAAKMEKLSKTIADQAKKIREQEKHERETMKRTEALRLATVIGHSIGHRVKEHIADQSLAFKITESICQDLREIIEDKDENDGS